MRPRKDDNLTFSPDGSAAKFYFDASTGRLIIRNASDDGWVFAGNGSAVDYHPGTLRLDYPDNQLGALVALSLAF